MRPDRLPRIGRRPCRLRRRRRGGREDFFEETTNREHFLIGSSDECGERIAKFGAARTVPPFEEPCQGQVFVQPDCVAFVAENRQERFERQDTIRRGVSHGPGTAARRPAPTWQWRQ